jgi:hypothetical protein
MALDSDTVAVDRKLAEEQRSMGPHVELLAVRPFDRTRRLPLPQAERLTNGFSLMTDRRGTATRTADRRC